MAGMSQYGIKRQNQTSLTGGIDIAALMQKLAKEFAPGGSVEKTYAADIEKEGKQLGAQLNASAVSRGLGNAAIGIPTTVNKSVSSAKQKLRSQTTTNYMAALQSLAQLALQQQQLGLQQQQANTASSPSTGYTRSGTKLTDFGFGTNPTASSFSTNTPNASSLKNLYASGGYGLTNTSNNYNALTGPLFGGTTSTESSEPEWDYSMLYGTSKTPSGGTVVY